MNRREVAQSAAALLMCVVAVLAGRVDAAHSAVAGVSTSNANACSPPAKFKGQQRGVYSLECGVCFNQGWIGIAEDLETRNRDPAVIARRYAETFYRAGPTRPAAHAGCLRGFGARLRDLCRTRKTGIFNVKARFQDRSYWCSSFS